MNQTAANKTLELDKICRVCLTIKKDMRPLFSEMMADMLMECTRIHVEDTDGWPDKICIQCVHQVSRCHAFKSRVEKLDAQLRQYIKGITVLIVEDPLTKINVRQPNAIQTHHRTPTLFSAGSSAHPPITMAEQLSRHIPTMTPTHRHDMSQVSDVAHLHPAHHLANQQMIITNNGHAQLINANQIVTTAQGQQIIQATPAVQPHPVVPGNLQLCQLVQTGNGTVQMIQPNGQPGQLMQIQRTNDDRCEIIMQPEPQFYTEDDLKTLVSVTSQAIHEEEILDDDDDDVQLIEESDDLGDIEEIEEPEEIGDIEELDEVEEIEEIEELEEFNEADDIEDMNDLVLEIEQDLSEEQASNSPEPHTFTVDLTEPKSVEEDKDYMAEFISMQTSCPYPGKFVCNLCRKEFKHSRWLDAHMKSHSNWLKANCKKQPQCQVCNRSFKGPGMLRMHMKTHEKHAETTPTCKICLKVFKSKTILYRHRQTHLEKLVQCGTCLRKFGTVAQLESHQSKTKHQKIFKCTHCDQEYENAFELKTHIQLFQEVSRPTSTADKKHKIE